MDKRLCILENAFAQIVNVSQAQEIPMRLAMLSLSVKYVWGDAVSRVVPID